MQWTGPKKFVGNVMFVVVLLRKMKHGTKVVLFYAKQFKNTILGLSWKWSPNVVYI